jgi:hypothetical protein
LGHKTKTEYDSATGNLKKLIPPHLQNTQYWHQIKYDPFGRKGLERFKDNPDPEVALLVDRGWTSYSYNNFGNPNTQNVEKIEHIVVEGDPGRTLEHHTQSYFDGLSRTYKVKSGGPPGKWILTETSFDNIGRVWKKFNPRFDTDPPPYYFTTFTYDGLSRAVDTVTPDGVPYHRNLSGLKEDRHKPEAEIECQCLRCLSEAQEGRTKLQCIYRTKLFCHGVYLRYPWEPYPGDRRQRRN